MSDSIVEQTYQALLSVVQTTAVTRKVLRRPPFTFLHKLLVETIGGYDLFTATQLDFSALVSKEDKAAFLTRALAFVTFAMTNAKEQCVSCLLLVSPIKVLAGVAVDDTLEFLLQLCVVCKSVDRDAKEAATQELLQKGDALLYKSSVRFRRGLILVQAVIRIFIRRRVGKRRAIEISARSQTGRILMSVGTRFLKELPHGRIYDGVIRSVNNNRYTLVYDQDPEAQDEVDEIEMKIILEESQRLTMYRDRISESGRRISKRNSKRSDDADISLTSLPDLSSGLITAPVRQSSDANAAANPHFIKRVSSGDSGVAMLIPKQQPPVLVRALSQRPTKTNLDALVAAGAGPIETSGVPSSSNNRPQARQSRSQGLATTSGISSSSSRAAIPTDSVVLDSSRPPTSYGEEPENGGKTWQASLKKMLDDGRQMEQGASPAVPNTGTLKSGASGKPQRQEVVRVKEKAVGVPASSTSSSRVPAAHTPNFPKLSIPGTKSLLPSTSKRRLNDAVASAAASTTETKGKSSAPGRSTDRSSDVESVAQPSATPDGSVANSNTARHSSNSLVSFKGSTGSESLADAPFRVMYQSTDQKTQEKLAFIREVVMHIDSYMKRKRLRVIDLFRFCDADGNGSISPQEMIDTLSQMEIQLTAEQGEEFINFIDKDGNGSIDIDEFEELVRVARRTDAHRDQLKEFNTSKRGAGEGMAPGKFTAIIKAKQRILEEFKSAQGADGEGVGSSHLWSMIANLALPNVDDACISVLIDKAVATTGSSGATSGGGNFGMMPSNAGGAKNSANTSGAAGGHVVITYAQLAKALDDLEWVKKANRFLNQAWIAHFDSQMERTSREFDLL